MFKTRAADAKGSKIIDLRSDTVTLPTREMWDNMMHATLLDHLLDEDPTVKTLQDLMAKELGKEETILLPSGTMSNLIAIMAQTNPGDSIIVEASSHINESEYGGMARFAGVQVRQIQGQKGYINPADIEKNIRINEEELCARTTLLTLENTHNLAGGIVLTPCQMNSMCRVAKKYGLAVHLDGARLFNAAVALGIEAKEFTESVDSITISLSKGLSAPIGSILASSKEVIIRAKKYKRMLGGGMHQEGILAAAGLVGLRSMMKQLVEDNQNARLLHEGLKEIYGITIDFSGVRTNILFFKLCSLKNTEFIRNLEKHHVRALPFGQNHIRMVTHRGITRQDIDFVLQVIKASLKDSMR